MHRITNIAQIAGICGVLLIGCGVLFTAGSSRNSRNAKSQVIEEKKRSCYRNIANSNKVNSITQNRVVVDDLEWLIGRWVVVKREVKPESYMRSAKHGVWEKWLEEFNVYYPFYDENIFPFLTGNPRDHPIAAEFLVRPAPKAALRIMGSTRSPVGIGINKIWYPLNRFERIEFKFKHWIDLTGEYLQLESDAVVITLRKKTGQPGDIRKSRAVSPIRNWPPWFAEYVHCRYKCMAAVARKVPVEELENRLPLVTERFPVQPR